LPQKDAANGMLLKGNSFVNTWQQQNSAFRFSCFTFIDKPGRALYDLVILLVLEASNGAKRSSHFYHHHG
jgi:hypothetical protein